MAAGVDLVQDLEVCFTGYEEEEEDQDQWESKEQRTAVTSDSEKEIPILTEKRQLLER